VNARHNVVHLLSRAIVLACGLANVAASRLYLRIFRSADGLVAILGFFQDNTTLRGLISNNMPDVWLGRVVNGAARSDLVPIES
jgi:hypothetical protein